MRKDSDKRSLDKKSEQIGMPIGKAAHKLRRAIIYHLAKKLDMDICYRCNKSIDKIEEFTIDHKIPYLNSENPSKLFFDLENIAFSHKSCNFKASRRPTTRKSHLKPIKIGVILPVKTHGSAGLRKGCRCLICKTYSRESSARAYKRRKERKKSSYPT